MHTNTNKKHIHTQSIVLIAGHTTTTLALLFMSFKLQREIPPNFYLKILLRRRKVWNVFELFTPLPSRNEAEEFVLLFRLGCHTDVQLYCTHTELEK